MAIFFGEFMNLKSKDLTEAWFVINSGCMTGKIPGRASLSQFDVSGEIILLSGSTKCKLNLNNFGYQDRKLMLLRNKYLDEESFSVFNESVKEGRKAMYYFKSSKVYSGKPKPNCLICIIYDNKKDEFTVVWRTTELLARFAADLVFLSEILLDKKIKLVILSSYQFTQVVYGVFKMNGVKFKKPKDINYKRSIIQSRDKFFLDDSEFYESWQPIKLVQQSYRKYLKSLKEVK